MHPLFNGVWYCLTFCCDHSLVFLSLQLSQAIGLLSMGARGRNPKRLNGDLLRSRDPCMRWRGQSMWTYSWKPRNNGPKTAPTTLSYSTRCSCMPHPKDRRRQSKLSAKAAGGTCPTGPEAGIPAIQLVHPEIDREKLLDLYLEVYKLHRLPSSPPGEPAILKEVLSALPCHSPEEKDTPDAQRQPHPEDFHPPWSRSSQWER